MGMLNVSDTASLASQASRAAAAEALVGLCLPPSANAASSFPSQAPVSPQAPMGAAAAPPERAAHAVPQYVLPHASFSRQFSNDWPEPPPRWPSPTSPHSVMAPAMPPGLLLRHEPTLIAQLKAANAANPGLGAMHALVHPSGHDVLAPRSAPVSPPTVITPRPPHPPALARRRRRHAWATVSIQSAARASCYLEWEI